MPEDWKTDEDYQLDQKAMELIKEVYCTTEVDYDRNWGEGVIPPELHSKMESLYAEKIKKYSKSDKRVLILMAGAGGIGKTTTLENYLNKLNDSKSPESMKLSELTGIPPGALTGKSFISLSHQSVKEEMCGLDGVEHIPDDWWKPLGDIPDDHSYRTEARPDLKSVAIHGESSYVMQEALIACLKAGVLPAYDVGVLDRKNLVYPLVKAHELGYTTVVISVEGPKEQALQGNYQKWRNRKKGQIASPEGLIEKAYQGGKNGKSICRKNIQELAEELDIPTIDGDVFKHKCVDYVIEVDRSSSDMRPGELAQVLKDTRTQTTPVHPVGQLGRVLLAQQSSPEAGREPSAPGTLPPPSATPLARSNSSGSQTRASNPGR